MQFEELQNSDHRLAVTILYLVMMQIKNVFFFKFLLVNYYILLKSKFNFELESTFLINLKVLRFMIFASVKCSFSLHY